MKSLYLLFLLSTLSPLLSLNATEPNELTLTYTIEGSSYPIAGFVDNNPYALIDDKKFFPKANGTWSVQGDLTHLAQFGLLLDHFRLYRNIQNFKEIDLPPSFSVRPSLAQFIPLVFDQEGDSFAYWDNDSFKNLTMIYAWIDGDNQSPANLINIDQNQLRYLNSIIGNLMTFDFSSQENQTKGFPVFWFIDQETQKIIPPKFHQNNTNAHLNWLVKSGKIELFKKEWADHKGKFKYKKGQITPLHLIALYQHNQFLEAIPELEKKFIKSEDSDENTPAHYAAFTGNSDFFKSLSNPKLAVNRYDKDGYTPLHQALFYGHTELVDFLLQNWNLQDQPVSLIKATPQLLALRFNRPDLLNLINHYNPKPFNLEPADFFKYGPKICLSGNVQAVQFLLQHSPESIDDPQKKPFITAAILSGNPEVLQLILTQPQFNPIPEQTPEAHLTYLHSAAILNEAAMIPLLIESGISINATTSDGFTPLFQAVLNNNFEATVTLLDLGADPDISSPDNVSPIWAATFNGHRDEIEALVQAGAKCDLQPDFANIMVEYATLYDIPQVIQIALDQCLSEDYLLHDEFPGIYVADYFGSKNVLQFLESKGQSLDSVQQPSLSKPNELDNPLKFIHQSAIPYSKTLSDKYGTLETNVHAIINKAGFLILPKLSPPLPPELTKQVRESLKTWQAEPPTAQGYPTNISVTFPLKLKVIEEIEEIFDLTQLSVRPKPISQNQPSYPPSLRRKKISGFAIIQFVVLKNGSTSEVIARESSHPEFAEAAIRAAKQWKFHPGIIDEKPVKSRVFIKIPFDAF